MNPITTPAAAPIYALGPMTINKTIPEIIPITCTTGNSGDLYTGWYQSTLLYLKISTQMFMTKKIKILKPDAIFAISDTGRKIIDAAIAADVTKIAL